MKKINKLSEKTLYYILLIGVILSMLPIWYLGRYAVPSLDDYYFGQMPHHAWMLTHSISDVFKAAGEMVNFYFYAKQATYSSVFLMSLFPGVLNEKWYFITPLIMTGMLIGSLTALVHTVMYDCFGVKNKYYRGIINLLLIFLSIQTMLVPLEGIYWYNGALHYVFMQSVMYFEIAALLKFIHSEEKSKRIIMLVIASLLGIVVGGGNLITGLQSCILVGLHIIVIVSSLLVSKKSDGFISKLGIVEFKKEKRNDLVVLIPEIITIIAFLVNVTAPGNSERQAFEEQMNPILAVIKSFYWGAVHGISWVTPIMIFTFIAITAVLWKTLRNNDKHFLNPLLMLIISFCVFAAMFTPTFYATSMDAPDRVKNIICTAENIIIFVNIANAIGYCRSIKTKANKDVSTIENVLIQTEERTCSVVFLCTVIILLIFFLPENKNSYTSMSAVRSIMNGEAARYYSQSWERIDVYNDPEIKEVTVHRLTDDAKPFLLFKEDIGDEEGGEGYWQSVEISDYYQKDSISVVD